MAIVVPTDLPKSVRNCCVIEVFLVVFLCYHVDFWIFPAGVGAFVLILSQISSFSLNLASDSEYK